MSKREEEVRDEFGELRSHVVAIGDEQAKHESAKRTRRSFVVGTAAAAAGYGLSQWVRYSHNENELQAGLRQTLNVNAAISRAVFDERGLAPTYPLSEARPLRLNGSVGLEQEIIPAQWRLQLVGAANANASPRHVADVTAWEYGYAGDMPDSPQQDDVKSAPGNGAGSKTGGADSKTGGAGSKSGKQDSSDDAKLPPPATSAPPAPKPAANTLNPTGAVDSAAGAAMAARFQAMEQAVNPNRKRYQGSDEAGASSSSLDIGTPGLLLTMDDLKQLPRVEFVTEFKCIEGWSNRTHWAGVRLRDLLDLHPPAQVNGREPRYVYMETPDGNFYGGYNMAAARHPQSLLVMEMDGAALTQSHGAPLRLHMPIKYGYKQLKRIGLIAYMDTRPDDYWTKLGYDWYAGL
jgi:hypothetical protein